MAGRIRKYASWSGLCLTLIFAGLGLVNYKLPTQYEKRNKLLAQLHGALDFKKEIVDSEFGDSEYVKTILEKLGVQNIQEYMAVFPWMDEIDDICKDWEIKNRDALYAAKVFVESSGDPESVSKKWYARGLMGARYAGAFSEIWKMVHSENPRYKMLREKFPNVHAYFKKVLKGKKLDFWKKKMINEDTLDPEFGLRVGIAYDIILDEEDHLGNEEDDIRMAEAKFNLGPTFVNKYPEKALEKSKRHVGRVMKFRKSFRETDKKLEKSRKHREKELGIPRLKSYIAMIKGKR